MVGFKLGKGHSTKTDKDYWYLDIYFTEKWYKRVFLTEKQYNHLQAVTITVIDN